MGFWKDDQGRRIGDGPLDAADEFLSASATEYKEQFGSLPTLDEVIETIRLQLATRLEEYVKNGDRLELVEIKAKTKKRPKKQFFHPGDVVAIPLNKYHFAYGHLTPQTRFMELFKVRTKGIVPVRMLTKHPKVRPNFEFMRNPIEQWHWKVIGNIPWTNYRIQHFLVAGQIDCEEKETDDLGFIRTALNTRWPTEEEKRNTPETIVHDEKGFVQELRHLLKGAPIL